MTRLERMRARTAENERARLEASRQQGLSLSDSSRRPRARIGRSGDSGVRPAAGTGRPRVQVDPRAGQAASQAVALASQFLPGGGVQAIPGANQVESGSIGTLDLQEAEEAQADAQQQQGFAESPQIVSNQQQIAALEAQAERDAQLSGELQALGFGPEQREADNPGVEGVQATGPSALDAVATEADADAALPGGTQTFRQDRFQIGADKGQRAPDGQQLFRSVTDAEGNIIGEVFANPEDFPEGDEGGKTVTQKSLSDQLNIVPGGKRGLELARRRADADVRSHITEQIRQAERAGNTSGAEELREQRLKTFDDFENDQADAATAEKFGITTSQAKILRGDFGKQPTQQAVPSSSRGRGESGGSRFVFKGQGGARVIDSQLGTISAEQAAQVQAQRDQQNLASQRAVQAQVAANQREKQAGQVSLRDQIAVRNLQRGEQNDANRRDRQARQDVRQQQQDTFSRIEAELSGEDNAEKRQKMLSFARQSFDQGGQLNFSQLEALANSVEAGEVARIAESGFFTQFSSKGPVGAVSGLLNLVDKASGEPFFRFLGINRGKLEPKNAADAVRILDDLQNRFNKKGGFGAVELKDVPKGAQAEIEAGFRMLPFMKQQFDQIKAGAKAQLNQGVQPR